MAPSFSCRTRGSRPTTASPGLSTKQILRGRPPNSHNGNACHAECRGRGDARTQDEITNRDFTKRGRGQRVPGGEGTARRISGEAHPYRSSYPGPAQSRPWVPASRPSAESLPRLHTELAPISFQSDLKCILGIRGSARLPIIRFRFLLRQFRQSLLGIAPAGGRERSLQAATRSTILLRVMVHSQPRNEPPWQSRRNSAIPR